MFASEVRKVRDFVIRASVKEKLSFSLLLARPEIGLLTKTTIRQQIMYMQKFQRPDWLRACQLIPNKGEI